MAANPNAPIIVKRKKIIQGGHHGGAWKVAYADFVTAMMAFFLLMWLLGATNEKQRKGIADYFNPTIPINKVSGGGDGAFGGDSVFTDATLAHSGSGVAIPAPGLEPRDGLIDARDEADKADSSAREAIESVLSGRGGESMVSDLLARHIVTELSDEGLVVELFATPDAPLFERSAPTNVLSALLGAVSEAIRIVENDVAVETHVATGADPAWPLSAARADAVRRQLAGHGLEPERLRRITGFGDGQPVMRNASAPRNDRVRIVLLRHRL